ncbi:MAG: deoxyribonuclease V [Symploca sp. SIO2E6]|nr:deoxyribonuclease V [Symploca sp. SIO2E6]
MTNDKQRHPWSVTVEEAIAIQQQLQSEVITSDQLGRVQYVAGVDVGFSEDGAVSRAAAVVLSFPELQLQDQAIALCSTTFPYTPGLLSFREVPAILEALEKLRITPDLILCDGQGIAHPRRFGLACHLGLLTEVPSIGVAKSWFIGEHNELPLEKGSWQPLRDQEEVIGAVVRSRTNVKPIYVSVGHLISLPTAIDYVLRCTPEYRLPQTTRLADQLASAGKRLTESGGKPIP